ncbi:hypothetical protein GOP47_0020852 [Adiantum capillus-veneris]|uniref:Phototropic-responsive NPH3 family protein n=1 Tax=Adiantum capillus-veneris TaxID=13818 RepID=A0A9D4UAR4_ADICA|nr:hypothetical protein GOP47_0020852 [Adiantum capillus-veneris]
MGTILKQSHSLLLLGRQSSPRISANQSRSRPPSPEQICDVVIKLDGTAFNLHKAPLCARSGRIKKLIQEHRDPWPLCIEFPNLPGGAGAFSSVVKSSRGSDIEINASNVAVMHCIATYLEMTEEYGIDNLLSLTESFLKTTICKNLKQCLQVLLSCQSILLQAEGVNLTGRCIDAIASIISSDTKHRNVPLQKQGPAHTSSPRVKDWTDDLTALPIDFFKKTIDAMRLKGIQEACIADALMHYIHRALKPYFFKSLETFICEQEDQPDQMESDEHEQRIALETTVNLLPTEKGVVPITFLFDLLRAGYLFDSTIACRMDLEKRIGRELEHASLEELLVPSSLSHSGDTHFDVDFVQRLAANFVQQDAINLALLSPKSLHKVDAVKSPLQVTIGKVSKLLDSYLAEVAADPNLKVTKFVNLMELLPNHARVLDDGKYRAIDIYLKTHPAINEEDQRRTCKCMDCQKLSQEARFHAAQNERLPVQVRVQVLYVEQLRLHSALLSLGGNGELPRPSYSLQRVGVCAVSHIPSPSQQQYAYLKQENEDLKMELASLRTRLSHLEKQDSFNLPYVMEKTSSMKSLFNTMSRTFRRIKPFARSSMEESTKKQVPPCRRYSMS